GTALTVCIEHSVAKARFVQTPLHRRYRVASRELSDLAGTLRCAHHGKRKLSPERRGGNDLARFLFGEIDDEATRLVVPADDIHRRKDDVLRRPLLHLQKINERQLRLGASFE